MRRSDVFITVPQWIWSSPAHGTNILSCGIREYRHVWAPMSSLTKSTHWTRATRSWWSAAVRVKSKSGIWPTWACRSRANRAWNFRPEPYDVFPTSKALCSAQLRAEWPSNTLTWTPRCNVRNMPSNVIDARRVKLNWFIPSMRSLFIILITHSPLADLMGKFKSNY